MSSRPFPARPAAPPYPVSADGIAADGLAADGVATDGGAADGGADALSFVPGSSWRSLLEMAAGELGDRREARWLLEEAAGTSFSRLRTRLDEPVDAAVAASFGALVGRRRAGQPLQHVLGHWSFRTLDLCVDGRALIPRPETEVVVELALTALEDVARLAGATGAGLRALDLGTGSGAIACALVAELPEVEVLAVDRSATALQLAAANRSRLPAGAARRLQLLHADWYQALAAGPAGVFQLVVSNPPYLAANELADLDPVVRDHEPEQALVAGPTGLECIDEVVRGAPAVLTRGGALVVEIAPAQAEAVRLLAADAGAAATAVVRDLAGRDRVLVARF